MMTKVVVLSIAFALALLPARGQTNCSGSFLAFNAQGIWDGGYDCWNCGYPFMPNITIKEPSPGRYADLRFHITDTVGNRLFGVPLAPGFIGYPVGIIYANNRVYWGSLGAHWMGVTSSFWHFGVQRYVMPLPAKYNTHCGYQGDILVHAEAKTYTPGVVGDTCYPDSIFIFPPCPPLGLFHEIYEEPPILQPQQPKQVFGTYDITGRNTAEGGLIILQMEDGSYIKGYILNK